jgi:diguanylate cyclase (GGDEF)-like protein
MSTHPLPTVLIVDDEAVNRGALAELLQGECRILLAKDGTSALQKVNEEIDNISLILLDVSMPGMDGYEVLARLRENKRTADISVIFITGQTDEQDEERGLLLGAADYVPKPIRPAIVRVRIRNHLKLAMQRRELEHLSEQDGLTGVANRRHFDRMYDQTCRRAIRASEPFGLAMMDIDHFKRYNDHYGHGAGDEALRKIGLVLGSFARRPYDVLARYGGEEFALLMPGPIDFEIMLKQMCHRVRELGIAHEASETSAVITISCGGIFLETTALAENPSALLQHADALLYKAKREGRNQVWTETL